MFLTMERDHGAGVFQNCREVVEDARGEREKENGENGEEHSEEAPELINVDGWVEEAL